MAKRWKAKAQSLMSRRAAHSQDHLREVISDGMKYARYIYGDPPLWHDPDRWAEYLREFGAESEDQKIKQGWLTSMVCMHAVLRGVVLPYALGGDARWFNERREGAGNEEIARNDLFARYSQMVWKRGDVKDELYRAMDDAFWARVGWIETDLDDRTDMPRHQWVDCRNVLVDREVRSPDHRQHRWHGVKEFLPIETAQWLAKERWDASGYEFTPVEFAPDDDDAYREKTEVVRGARRSERSAEVDAPTDFVRILRVFVKGENPHTDSADLSKKRMGDPAGKDAVYDGKDHVLILEACGGYGLSDGYNIVGRVDWPFPCDPGETPLTPFKLTRDNRDFYPYSIMQPSHPLQVITNVAVGAYFTDMRNSARRVGAVQPEAFADETTAKEMIEGDDALPIAELKKGFMLDQAIQIKNFGAPNSSLEKGAEIGQALYRLISGLQSFEVEVRANQTAFNTAVQNTQSQLKLRDITELPERASISLQRKALMCARANLNYEEIRRWITNVIGPDGENYEKEQFTSKGKRQLTSELWPTKPDWRDIRDEIEIQLEPRSMQHKNPDQQAAELKEITEYQVQMIRIAGDAVKGGSVSAGKEIMRVMNKSVEMICKLKNILHWEELMADPDSLVPEAPPVDPNTVIEAQSDQAVAAQQAAATTRLQQQGIPSEGIPAAVGGGGQ